MQILGELTATARSLPLPGRVTPEVLEVGPLEILPEEHLARAEGPGADALDPRAAPAHRARAARGPDHGPRGAVPAGLGEGDAAGRPVGRRLRAQAPGEAPGGAARMAVHPHALRLRLPARARALTASQTGRSQLVNTRASRGRHTRPYQELAPDRKGEDFEYTSHRRGRDCGRCSARGRRLRLELQLELERELVSRARPSSSGGSATLNGAGSTFAAPIYQQWGSNLKSPGPDRQLQPGRIGRGHRRSCRPRRSTSPAATRR